ncbi:hypothetical protein [Streptomyces sp. NPDC002215]|uniref:hypothetical protein n=1 Tax=Streptomyces sp. NPDC002215 TaxID=3154412 RepID=UPI003316E515
MVDAVRDATLLMGVHGVLTRHPWLTPPESASASGPPEDTSDSDSDVAEDASEAENVDVFGLAVNRAEAYGWSSTLLGAGMELGGSRWGHNDAGEDWTQDGRVREIGWLQVDVSSCLNRQRLPVLPVATVLGDVLRQVGDVRVTGVHTVAPVHLAPDPAAALLYAAHWYELADPGAARDITVTVSGRDAGLPGRGGRVRDEALACSYGRMTVEPENTAVNLPGLSRSPTGKVQTEGMRRALAFRCRVPVWSLDAAAWTTEVFVEALRATGTAEPVLITVSC